MDFDSYLKNKKIDPSLFQKAEPKLWHEFKTIFDQVHPDSFTAQKLFLINGIRRKYPFIEEDAVSNTENTEQESAAPKKPKPKVKTSSSASAKPKPKMAPKVKVKMPTKKKD